jgi:hypothetical protein
MVIQYSDHILRLSTHQYFLGLEYRMSPFFLIPFYLQVVQIHSENGVKLLEAFTISDMDSSNSTRTEKYFGVHFGDGDNN